MSNAPLFGLFFVGSTVINVKFQTEAIVSASHDIDKLKASVPHITLWNQYPEHEGTRHICYHESGNNQKFLIREIPFIS